MPPPLHELVKVGTVKAVRHTEFSDLCPPPSPNLIGASCVPLIRMQLFSCMRSGETLLQIVDVRSLLLAGRRRPPPYMLMEVGRKELVTFVDDLGGVGGRSARSRGEGMPPPLHELV